MTLHDPNLKSDPAKPQTGAELTNDILETNPAAKTCMTHAQVAALHLCPRCGRPAPAEFCRACGHRQCVTCGD